MSARFVRRRSLRDQVSDRLDFSEWFLWFTEELNSSEWEDFLTGHATSLGLMLNATFILARANSTRPYDDSVFGEDEGRRSSGWLSYLCHLLTFILTALSFANAWYTFSRKKYYRLFEQPIDAAPTTPSARRVRVDSSPSNSPLNLLKATFSRTLARERAHPDQFRDVWEVAVWDPTPICLKLLCCFSPIHVIIYAMFLPITDSEAWKSVVYTQVIFIGALLWAQATLLQSYTTQRFKDVAFINKEVLHEYDTKFVHPSLNKPARDVGTQTPPSSDAGAGADPLRSSPGEKEVETYRPHIPITRTWRVSPNPNYKNQYDPDRGLDAETNPRLLPARQQQPSLKTPRHLAIQNSMNSPQIPSSGPQHSSADFSSPVRQRSPVRHVAKGTGDGGNLGVLSHANSPARKPQNDGLTRRVFRSDAAEGASRKEGSPLKRQNYPADDAAGSGTSHISGSRDLERRLRELKRPI